MPKLAPILRVAIPTPLRQTFDYLAPPGYTKAQLKPGTRIRAPFGKREVIGVIVATTNTPQVPRSQLKSATEILDQNPLLPPALMTLTAWASEYYHHPIGDVISSAMPQLLRLGQAAKLAEQAVYKLSEQGLSIDPDSLKQAPRQMKLLHLLRQNPQGLDKSYITHMGIQYNTMKTMQEKGWLTMAQPETKSQQGITHQDAHKPALNQAQQQAITAILQHTDFQPFLLNGITGSGKTEVYLNVIEQVLKQGRQALVLVPEIGLTPQTVARFQQRFCVNIMVLHSGLTPRERMEAWLLAKLGKAAIIIGTRSAIFTPLLKPGVIILDEEHDLSFKQQSGLRYSARDLAIVRAQLEKMPVILGSATPSLESLSNSQRQRFQQLLLPERTGTATPPKFHILDIRNQHLEEGISSALLKIIEKHLAQDGQALLFLNRRGYAPVLLCHSCGWSSKCSRCDAKLTLHQQPARLVCHHCGAVKKPAHQCPECKAETLLPLGLGTERLQQVLQKHFPNIPMVRIDRDSTRQKGKMETMLETIISGQSRLLIGTQMLAKGHHFPNVTLVGIINGDSGLYSSDFRASERMSQLIIQVAGRAGRADKPGEVYIQTHNPNHPLLQTLINHGYQQFSQSLLKERYSANLPPFSYHAIIRAEAAKQITPKTFLQQIRQQTQSLDTTHVKIFGPLPAVMARKAGLYRAQLALQSQHRKVLQNFLQQLLPRIESLPSSRKVRWCLDVDPQEI